MSAEKIPVIPNYQSPVRRATSEVFKLKYLPLKSLKEARKYKDAYVIMEGDWGGQIYLSAPIKLVYCNHATLKRLLKYLDDIAFSCYNKGDGTGIYFERLKERQRIIGGMGGGFAKKSLWVHKKFTRLRVKINKIISGKQGI